MMRAGSLDDVPGLADDLGAIVPPPEAWTVARGRDVDCMPLAAPDGTVRAAVIVNRSAKAQRIELRATGGVSARDPFGGEAPRTTGDDMSLTVASHGARLLVVD
jgi:hypothetical protein